jgi:hypothetical protein
METDIYSLIKHINNNMSPGLFNRRFEGTRLILFYCANGLVIVPLFKTMFYDDPADNNCTQ